jgi:hypothetical protein
LVGGTLIAIDVNKIEAVAAREQMITPKNVAKKMAVLDGKIAAHPAAMD